MLRELERRWSKVGFSLRSCLSLTKILCTRVSTSVPYSQSMDEGLYGPISPRTGTATTVAGSHTSSSSGRHPVQPRTAQFTASRSLHPTAYSTPHPHPSTPAHLHRATRHVTAHLHHTTHHVTSRLRYGPSHVTG